MLMLYPDITKLKPLTSPVLSMKWKDVEQELFPVFVTEGLNLHKLNILIMVTPMENYEYPELWNL